MSPQQATRCSKCGHSNPTGNGRCALCDSEIAIPTGEFERRENVTVTGMDWSRAATPPSSGINASEQTLDPGTILSERYEIINLLGQGGMGVVYKARDIELDRLIALKVIRPELAGDQKTLRRFKKELILARQITHRNVIRIFDFGSSNNVKYITMEYVEGQDLASVLDQRRPTAKESALIVRQVCRALEAAHAESVIHRDLKPQNIMLDASGRVRVMDFGLARSVEMSGLTRTGAVMGTPAYMSPEQARGIPLDARTDLYSLGLILYELLTGETPFKAESAWAVLLARTQAPPPPPLAADPSVPQPLSDLAMKCLAIDPDDRYQSASEVAADLDGWLGDAIPASVVMTQASAAIPGIAPTSQPVSRKRKWLAQGAIATAVCLAMVAGVTLLKKPPATVPNTVTVLVADFTNHTGDPVFDNTLEPMFNIALEGARFINAFNRGEARRLARQLPNPTEQLQEQSARLVAVSQGLGAIVTGALSRRGRGYKLSVEAIDATSGNTISSSEVIVSSKDEVSLAIPKLAAPIRKALGDTTPESLQVNATRGTFTAASLEAAHQYGVAMEQQFAGKMEDAFRSFNKAAELDPNFARAYFGMAATSNNLNRVEDAEKYLKMAMERVDRMTERERYRTRGFYYLRAHDMRKCIEEYGELVARFPADNVGHQNLAACYSDLRDMPKALQEARRAVEIAPKSAVQRRNLALVAAYAGDAHAAQAEARAALQLNPTYAKAYLSLAYGQLLQGQTPDAADTYRQLEKVSPLGASLASSGLADIAMYEGRLTDAVRILKDGASRDAAAGNLFEAEKFVALAYAQLLRGEKRLAVEAAAKAAVSKKPNIQFLAGRVYVAAGEIAQARSLAASLASNPHLEPQANARLIDGEITLQAGNAHEAVRTFTEANQLLDTWMGRLDLGRAYLAAGQFAEADSEFDRCIKRRGEALELDDAPTFGYFPPVYYYQGRVREGLNSPGAAESFRTYLNIRGKAGEDPLLAELRRRAR